MTFYAKSSLVYAALAVVVMVLSLTSTSPSTAGTISLGAPTPYQTPVGTAVPLSPGTITPIPTTCYRSCTISRSIQIGSDDAGDYGDNGPFCPDSASLNEVYLGFCSSGSEVISGLRFQNIDIPAGSEITEAHLVFSLDGHYSGNVSIRFYVDDPYEPFPNQYSTPDTYHSGQWPHQRPPLATPYLQWDIRDDWELGQEATVTGLGPLVQELVNQTDWQQGQPIAFQWRSVHNGTSHRRIIAYERPGSASLHPAQLVITYNRPESSTPTPLPNPLIRATAVAYADTWALGMNPQYNFYPKADCTNFVSQATYAAGYPMTDVWYHNPMEDSWAWANVAVFDRFFEESNWGTYWGDLDPEDEDLHNPAEYGDILVYDWEGNYEYDHMGIEVVYDGTDPGLPVVPPTPYWGGQWQGDLVDTHENPHYHAIWHLRPYNTLRDTTQMYVLHINYNR